jgi:GNAT superfamily N-acetyltransferase
MSTTTHSIYPATESDLPIFAHNLHESKLALTINRVLWKDWPNDAAQRPQYTNAIESSFKNDSSDMFKVVDDETGTIVGHLVVTLIKPQKVEEGDGKANMPGGVNPDVFKTVMEFAKEVDTFRDVEHFGKFFDGKMKGSAKVSIELTHIFVTPSHRRRGIGTQLVKLAVEKAEKAGLPLALGSEPAAHDFFLTQGFKDTKHVDIDLRKWAAEYSGFGIFRFSGMVKSQ